MSCWCWFYLVGEVKTLIAPVFHPPATEVLKGGGSAEDTRGRGRVVTKWFHIRPTQ